MQKELFADLYTKINKKLFATQSDGSVGGLELLELLELHTTNLKNEISSNSIEIQLSRIDSIETVLERYVEQVEQAKKMLSIFDNDTTICLTQMLAVEYGYFIALVVSKRLTDMGLYSSSDHFIHWVKTINHRDVIQDESIKKQYLGKASAFISDMAEHPNVCRSINVVCEI